MTKFVTDIEASKSKWVNSILNLIGVKSLKLGSLHIYFIFVINIFEIMFDGYVMLKIINENRVLWTIIDCHSLLRIISKP